MVVRSSDHVTLVKICVDSRFRQMQIFDDVDEVFVQRFPFLLLLLFSLIALCHVAL